MSKDKESVGKDSYKYCFVPQCKNTTTRTPEKTFISVPRSLEIRKLWCTAAKFTKTLRDRSNICEDHFKLEEDLENYIEWRLTNCRKKLKEGVYPRFFSCQKKTLTSRSPSTTSTERWSVNSIPPHANCDLLNGVVGDEIIYTPLEQRKDSHHLQNSQEHHKTPDEQDAQSHFPVNRNIQVAPVTFDKKIQARPCNRHIAITCQLINALPLLGGVQTSTDGTDMAEVSPENSVENQIPEDSRPSVSETEITEDPRLNVCETKMNSNDTINSSLDAIRSDILDNSSAPSTRDHSLKMQHLKMNIFENITKLIIEDNPLLFLGLPVSSMYVLDEFLSITNTSKKNVYITMKKIRQNIPNAILGYEFGLSESQISRVFRITVEKMAEKFQELITWPSKAEISINLPIQFRLNYGEVQSIIDCFEIQIEHLSDAVHQAATWSDYKKCNTSKYLISITPDGLINFISPGFGGRASDIEIVKNSGYLTVLPPSSSVLADRGFKQVDTLLQTKKCKLLRPPSVQTDERLTEEDVIKTKRVASVRIHVERVIRRLREFKMLQAHVILDHNLLLLMDDIVIIAAAFVNLQSKIIDE